MAKSDLVFDIETDGLFPSVSKVHLFVGIDLKTDKRTILSPDHEPLSRESLQNVISDCRMLIGHNILMYDIPVLEKLMKVSFKGVILVDTMNMSQCLDYKRFGGRHSLQIFGESLKGIGKKVEHDDWSKYSKEMLHRCVSDVEMNVKIYRILFEELDDIEYGRKKYLKNSIRTEHSYARFCSWEPREGWPFDIEGAKNLEEKYSKESEDIENEILPMMKAKLNKVDQNPKSPRWVKNGDYHTATSKWFDIDPKRGQLDQDRPLRSPYVRFTIVPSKLSSDIDLKAFLKDQGWIPDTWNYKRQNGKVVRTSPQITESSLLAMGELGRKIAVYNSNKSRIGVLKGWIEAYHESTGRLYGSIFPIGTPTFRSRHNVIANVPNKMDIRSLFTVSGPDRLLLGIDSKSNQNRGLCHLIGNKEYTDLVLHGDIHQRNSEVIQDILRNTFEFDGSLKESRGKAKSTFYAIIFGAGFGKVGRIITGKNDPEIGKLVQTGLIQSVPGFESLLDSIKAYYFKHGHLIGIDGKKIYCSSNHKLLNYLLQGFEKCTMAAAIHYLADKYEQSNIWYEPRIVLHDEIQLEIKMNDEKEAIRLGLEAFSEGPKMFNVHIMEGDARVGKTWADTH